MAEPVHSGAQQILRVGQRGDVRHDAETMFVRFVDDGAIQLRLQLLDRAIPVVHPDLDEVRLAGGELPDLRAGVVFGRHAVRRIAHRHARSGVGIANPGRCQVAVPAPLSART